MYTPQVYTHNYPFNTQAMITHALGWLNLWAAWNLGPGRHGRATPPAYRLNYPSNWVALCAAAGPEPPTVCIEGRGANLYATEPT